MSGTVKFFNEPKINWFEDTCSHDIFGCQGSMCISNNDDTWYKEVFNSREEAEEFLFKFQDMIELAFPKES